jgi:hypothetical protein
MTLKQSIYVLISPIFMIFAMLACAGTPLLDVPHVTCATPIQATVLPGTPAPIPPTPVIISSPDDFYIGDKVIVGNQSSPLRVQLRLLDINTYPISPDNYGNPRQIVSWRLRVKNIGTQDYEIFPALQMFVSEVDTAYDTQTGTWGATQVAGDLIGQTVDNDIYTLAPNQTRTFRLVAFAPAGTVQRFAFVRDLTVTDSSEQIVWHNQQNPIC